MYTVHKFPIDLQSGADQSFMMPMGAEILDVQVQNGVPTLWAFVDTDAPIVQRRIVMVGTGTDAFCATSQRQSRPYIGTVQLRNGMLVLHFFDRGEVK